MNIKFCLFILLNFVALLAFTVNAQEKEPELIAEIPLLNCDSRRSVIDSFLLDLVENPDSVGMIRFHPDKRHPLTPYMILVSAVSHLELRKFDERLSKIDENRVIFVLGEEEPKFRMQFWIAPKDKADDLSGRPWDYTLRYLNTPQIAHMDSYEDGLGCDFNFSTKFYADFLNANKNLIGRIVIHAKSSSNFNRARDRIKNDLVKIQNVSLAQLQFAYVKSDQPNVEYWYLPGNP